MGQGAGKEDITIFDVGRNVLRMEVFSSNFQENEISQKNTKHFNPRTQADKGRKAD